VSIKRDYNKKALTVSFCQLKSIKTKRHKHKLKRVRSGRKNASMTFAF